MSVVARAGAGDWALVEVGGPCEAAALTRGGEVRGLLTALGAEPASGTVAGEFLAAAREGRPAAFRAPVPEGPGAAAAEADGGRVCALRLTLPPARPGGPERRMLLGRGAPRLAYGDTYDGAAPDGEDEECELEHGGDGPLRVWAEAFAAPLPPLVLVRRSGGLVTFDGAGAASAGANPNGVATSVAAALSGPGWPEPDAALVGEVVASGGVAAWAAGRPGVGVRVVGEPVVDAAAPAIEGGSWLARAPDPHRLSPPRADAEAMACDVDPGVDPDAGEDGGGVGEPEAPAAEVAGPPAVTGAGVSDGAGFDVVRGVPVDDGAAAALRVNLDRACGRDGDGDDDDPMDSNGTDYQELRRMGFALCRGLSALRHAGLASEQWDAGTEGPLELTDVALVCRADRIDAGLAFSDLARAAREARRDATDLRVATYLEGLDDAMAGWAVERVRAMTMLHVIYELASYDAVGEGAATLVEGSRAGEFAP